MKIVIVGASFAGLSCALEAVPLYPEAEISLIDAREDLLYAPNAVCQLLKGEVHDIEETKVDLWQQVLTQPINLLLGYQLTGLDIKRQEVFLNHQGQVIPMAYDKLVLALGAEQSHQLADKKLSPYLLTFKGKMASLTSWEHLQKGGKVGIVGAGQMGMEVLDALHQSECEVEIFETQAGPLSKHLDSDFSEQLLRIMEEHQLVSHFQRSVHRVSLSERSKPQIETLAGQCEVDWVVLATNFTPNTDTLPKDLEQNQDGSLWVDAYLRTNHPNIWAVGDLIQFPVAYFGQSYMPMIRHSLLTGRVAAHNLLGNRLPMTTAKRLVASQLFGWTILSLGMTKRELDLCEDYLSLAVKEEDFWLKIHLQQDKQVILGAQLLTKDKDNKLIELLNWAVDGEVPLPSLLARLMRQEVVSEQERRLQSLLMTEIHCQEESDEI